MIFSVKKKGFALPFSIVSTKIFNQILLGLIKGQRRQIVDSKYEKFKNIKGWNKKMSRFVFFNFS